MLNGFFPALRHELATEKPTGLAFPIQAGLMFLLSGPSRLGALAVNFAYFLLLQFAFGITLHWLTRRWSVAVLGVGMLLTLSTPFLPMGGLDDYRIDFSAFCLFGIVLCLVVRSQLFLSWRWSLAAGAVASWLILCRFLTLTYFAGIVIVLGGFLWLRRWLSGTNWMLYERTTRQLRCLGGTAALAALLASPFLWLNRHAIFDYYVIGHVTGPEKELRAWHAGIHHWGDASLFYFRALRSTHLGSPFVMLAGLSLLTCLGLRWLAWRRVTNDQESGSIDWVGLGVFFLTSLMVPYLILTLDVSKSDIVASILIPSVMWLVLLPVLLLHRAEASGRPTLVNGCCWLLASLSLTYGFTNQGVGWVRFSFSNLERGEFEKVGELVDAIGQHCCLTSCLSPKISVNCLDDLTHPTMVAPFLYERQRILLTPRFGVLGNQLFAVPEAAALDELSDSDVVILVNGWNLHSPFPFDRCMRETYPQMKAYCDRTLRRFAYVNLIGREVFLYGRPALEVATDLHLQISPTPGSD